MAVSNQQRRYPYNVTVPNQVLAFNNLFFNSSDLAVVATNLTTFVDTLLVLNTHYTVSGAGVEAGGSVTLIGDYTGQQVTIYGNQPLTQPSEFNYQGQFSSQTVEQMSDRTTIEIQQAKLQWERSYRVPISDGPVSPINRATCAGKLFGFDANGVEDFSNSVASIVGAAVNQINIIQTGDYRTSVVNFGAKVDGVTNDTVAVQAAINSGGKEIYFPPGICEVENLVGISNQSWIGVPGATTIRLRSAAAVKIILTLTSQANVSFYGIKWDLNGLTNSVCLNLVGVTDGSISQCEFGGNYGVYLQGATNNIRITNNKFANGNYAIITGNNSTTKNVTITGNTFRNLTGDGVAVNCPTGTADRWTVVGNVFDTLGSNVFSGFATSFSGNYIDNVSVCGNVMHRCYQGAHIEDGTRNIVVDGNVMTDMGYGSVQSYRSGVYIAATIAGREISNVTISNNIIVGVSTMDFGIFVGPTVEQIGVNIVNNTIVKHLTYGIRFGGQVKNSRASGNIIYNGAGPGILGAGVNNIFAENRCFDTQGVKTQTYGIEVGGGTDNRYINNFLRDNLTNDFLFTSLGTRSIFDGNGFFTTTISITGTVNDRIIALSQVVELTAGTSTPQITGFVARPEVPYLVVKNNGGDTIALMHQNAGSSADNRLIMKAGADLNLTSGQARQFYYFSNRWNEI